MNKFHLEIGNDTADGPETGGKFVNENCSSIQFSCLL